MSVSVNVAVAGTNDANGLGVAGSVVTSGVNALVAGGIAAAAGGGASTDFSDPNNSMYAIYFSIGVGVN